jgi:hypothetical protein
MQITFYSYVDTGSSTIAYPKNQNYPTVHNAAGGAGTYSDPLTVGSEKSELAPGTLFYFPFLQKYGVVEDACATCTQLWQSQKQYAVRVWIGGDSTYALTTLQQLQSCESYLTARIAQETAFSLVDLNPGAALTIKATPIFSPPNPSLTGLTTSTCTDATS